MVLTRNILAGAFFSCQQHCGAMPDFLSCSLYSISFSAVIIFIFLWHFLDIVKVNISSLSGGECVRMYLNFFNWPYPKKREENKSILKKWQNDPCQSSSSDLSVGKIINHHSFVMILHNLSRFNRKKADDLE